MGKPRRIRLDWAMKNLLRDEANFDVSEGFLSALLEDKDKKFWKSLKAAS
jgi:hypothetical protein